MDETMGHPRHLFSQRCEKSDYSLWKISDNLEELRLGLLRTRVVDHFFVVDLIRDNVFAPSTVHFKSTTVVVWQIDSAFLTAKMRKARVYALLGLVADNENAKPVPDYSKSTEEIFIARSRNVHLPTQGLPSWVSDWRIHSTFHHYFNHALMWTNILGTTGKDQLPMINVVQITSYGFKELKFARLELCLAPHLGESTLGSLYDRVLGWQSAFENHIRQTEPGLTDWHWDAFAKTISVNSPIKLVLTNQHPLKSFIHDLG